MNFLLNHSSRRSVMAIVAVIMACMTMTSCQDDNYYNHPLVGNWELVAPAGEDYNCFYFYPDGSGQYYVEDYWGNDWYNFAWETDGNYLTVYFRNGDVWYYRWAMQGYSLYLYTQGNIEPYVYNYF